MIVDGKAITKEIKEELKKRIARLPQPPTLDIFVMSDDFATSKFVAIKKKTAAEVGVPMREVILADETTTEELIAHIRDSRADGMVVQLPLAPHIDLEAVLAAIPREKDPDVMSHESQKRFMEGDETVLPPVTGALVAVLETHRVDPRGKRIAIVGNGKLVGQPAAVWFRNHGAEVTIVNRKTPDIGAVTRASDIIVLGTGKPGILTPDMITERSVVLDAGTSETAGKLAGDADPACAQKAALFTPVPGGIGPITVAIIFRNLLALLAENKN